MTVEEQLEAMQAQIASLTEVIQASSKSASETTSPPNPTPPEPDQDAIIAKLEAEKSAKNDAKSTIAQQAQAYKFVTDELPTLAISPETQAVINAYNGDRDDYLAHQHWVMRAYLKTEALARLSDESIQAMPQLYREAISEAKTARDFDVPRVYKMVRELEDQAKKEAEQQAKMQSLQLANRISDEELAKLSPEKQREYQALQRYQQADIDRWDKFNGGKK